MHVGKRMRSMAGFEGRMREIRNTGEWCDLVNKMPHHMKNGLGGERVGQDRLACSLAQIVSSQYASNTFKNIMLKFVYRLPFKYFVT